MGVLTVLTAFVEGTALGLSTAATATLAAQPRTAMHTTTRGGSTAPECEPCGLPALRPAVRAARLPAAVAVQGSARAAKAMASIASIESLTWPEAARGSLRADDGLAGPARAAGHSVLAMAMPPGSACWARTDE